MHGHSHLAVLTLAGDDTLSGSRYLPGLRNVAEALLEQCSGTVMALEALTLSLAVIISSVTLLIMH